MGNSRNISGWVSGLAVLALAAGLSPVVGPVAGATASPPPVGPAGAAEAASDTVLVSATSDGTPGNGEADRPQVSGSGRFVTFDSWATNLVPGVTTPGRRVYRKDLVSGVVQMVSMSDDDQPTDAWSSLSWPDDTGRLVGFVSDAIDLADVRTTTRSVYLRNLGAGTTELISIGIDGRAADGASSRVMVSSTGRYVAFSSSGSNLTAAGGNGNEQVYLRDRVTDTTRLVSVADGGGLGDARSYRGMVSADGRYVAFASFAGNLVPDDGSPSAENIYLRDLVTGTTRRVSNLPSGLGGPNGGSRPYLTPDGESIIFNSLDELVPSDTNGLLSDVYVYDVATDSLERQSVSTSGGDGNDDSLRGFLSDDSRYATFNSFSSNLVPSDPNASGDVFLRDRTTATTTLLSRSHDGGGADAQSFRPVIADDASRVVYQSEARNLVEGDTSTGFQVYAVDTGLGSPRAPDQPRHPRPSGADHPPEGQPHPAPPLGQARRPGHRQPRRGQGRRPGAPPGQEQVAPAQRHLGPQARPPLRLARPARRDVHPVAPPRRPPQRPLPLRRRQPRRRRQQVPPRRPPLRRPLTPAPPGGGFVARCARTSTTVRRGPCGG